MSTVFDEQNMDGMRNVKLKYLNYWRNGRINKMYLASKKCMKWHLKMHATCRLQLLLY